jgi:hypothetical protein
MSPTLSYVVTRTVTLTVDVTPDEATEAREIGETLAEYAAAVADVHPASAWTVVDETVMPS